MGAMGATFLGAANPERFDAIAALGGPLDAGYFLSYLERHHLGGFCTLEELEAILAANPDHPEVLDDPSMLACMEPAPARMRVLLPERRQSFNRWVYTSNGGSFDRDSYLDLFDDLSRAFGDLLMMDPLQGASDEGLCDAPLVFEGVYDRAYNPEAKYPVITFCDGEEPVWVCKDSARVVDVCEEPDPELACSAEGGPVRATKNRHPAAFREGAGGYDPCAPHHRPVSFGLAVDLNRNGKRDYGEPILIQSHEPFEDVGVDGCPNHLEDGRGGCVSDPSLSPFASGVEDPNGDDFHWLTNPSGTEGNLVYDFGEPFEDVGVDGVAGTNDYGEGDGRFTEIPARLRFRLEDGRTMIREGWTEADRSSVSFYADGGIRDLFNFDVSSGLLFGEIAAGRPAESGAFLRLSELPGAPLSDTAFLPLSIEEGALPRNLLFLYGNEGASEREIEAGDGDHAGTTRQVLNRLQLLFRWLGDRWESLPDPPGDRSSFHTRASSRTFRSEALGGVLRDYAVVLPPGYDAPENADARYPVLYLLHGYGMHAAGPGGFYEQAILFDGAMASGKIRKMIVVFPSGGCCYRDPESGERICTEYRESGEATSADRSLEKLCRSGTFYVDSAGRGGEDEIAYGRSFFELMDEVDEKFRTLPSR